MPKKLFAIRFYNSIGDETRKAEIKRLRRRIWFLENSPCLAEWGLMKEIDENLFKKDEQQNNFCIKVTIADGTIKYIRKGDILDIVPLEQDDK